MCQNFCSADVYMYIHMLYVYGTYIYIYIYIYINIYIGAGRAEEEAAAEVASRQAAERGACGLGHAGDAGVAESRGVDLVSPGDGRGARRGEGTARAALGGGGREDSPGGDGGEEAGGGGGCRGRGGGRRGGGLGFPASSETESESHR